MSKELLERIKTNGLIPYKNQILKYIVCNNCGLEKPLNIWLNEHGKKCKLPKLNIHNMT